MTTAEFDRWFQDLTLRWPSVSVWLARSFVKDAEEPDELPKPDEAQQRALLRTWRDVLADVTLTDCLAVNKQMQSGELEWVGEYDSDKERLPQHVRRLARKMAWERNGLAGQGDDLPPLVARGSGFPAGKILQRLWELKEQGLNHDEARAQALAELPVGDSRGREPRYHCPTCLDLGHVHVASNYAIEAILAGTFERCHHRDAVMRCFCPAGQRLRRKSHGQELPFETFNAALDFKVADPLWRDREVLRLADWATAQVQSRAEAMARANPNYDPSFTTFNQREFA